MCLYLIICSGITLIIDYFIYVNLGELQDFVNKSKQIMQQSGCTTVTLIQTKYRLNLP